MRYVSVILGVLAFSGVGDSYAQISTQNYVLSRKMLNEGGTSYIDEIQYYDGIGRPTETVEKGVQSGSIKSRLASLQEYDAYGRPNSQWQPTPVLSDYLEIEQLKSLACGSNGYNDSRPYSSVIYESSPLNRELEHYGAGAAWFDGGHSVKTEYLTNTSNGVQSCKMYRVNNNTLDGGTTNYAVGMLHVKKITDEDGKCNYEFTGLDGRLILTRQVNGSEYLDTYYVYDDFGNLRFVLQPMYQTTADVNLYAYQYNYDSRRRCVRKKLPGCEYISYVYDTSDRLSFSQDGEQRKTGKWRFYLYDNMGRLCVQGINNSSSAGSGSTIVSFQSSQSGVCATGYVLSGTCTLTSPIVEVANYYDNYDYQQHNIFTSCGQISRLKKTSPTNAIGFITGSVVSLSDGEKLYSAIYYDKYGRPVDSRKALLDGRVMTESTTYSFTDNPTNKSVSIYDAAGISASSIVQNTYGDSFDRLTESQLRVATKNAKTSSFTYDNFGRLSSITRSGSAGTLSYGYNVRGWLTSISGSFNESLYYNTGSGTKFYNGRISSMTWQNDEDAVLRGYKYSYDDLSRMIVALYGEGASISTNAGRYNEIVPSYDKNGAITNIVRLGRQNSGSYGPIDNLKINYNGNQLQSASDAAVALTYNGSFDFKDDTSSSIEYTYDANGRLTSDANRGIALIEYDGYDNPHRIQFTNGNVTSYVYSAAGEKLRTVWLTAVPNVTVAIGGRKELTPSLILSSDTTDYVGGFIYSNGKVSRLQFDGGYCSFPDGNIGRTFIHYYDFDHQGNIRALVSENGTKEQITHYYPFGGIIPDISTNQTLQPYKYNGKELDRMHGLDTYDYGARQYNPLIGVWDKPDAYSEKYYNVNPYVYCMNNPVNYIDPDGKDNYSINLYGEIYFESKTDERFDKITAKNNSYIVLRDKKFLKELMKKRDNYEGNFTITSSYKDAATFFKFASENTVVEWGMDGYKNDTGTHFLVRTSHSKEKVTRNSNSFNDLDLFYSIHSHPGNSPAVPSGFEYEKNGADNIYYIESNDYIGVTNVYNEFKKAKKKYPSSYPDFYIYHPKTKRRVKYNPFKSNLQTSKIWHIMDFIKK